MHIGRQGLYDRDLELVAHELLFRPTAGSTTSGEAPGDRETTSVILTTFTVFGLHELVGDHPAFVNLTRPFMVGDLPVPFDPTGTVLELLEDVPADDAVLDGVRRLRDAGFRIALDDFLWTQEDRHPLLPLADVVKIDISELTEAELGDTVSALRTLRQGATDPTHPTHATDATDAKDAVARLLPRTAGGLVLVAEHVETPDQLARCRALGFDLLQGYALLRPEVVSVTALEPHRIACLELLRRLTDPDLRFEDVESLVVRDAALTYRVLLAANAAASGVRRRLTSIRQALVMLGTERLRGWLVLLVAADDGRTRTEPLTAALTRARMCEILAPAVGVAPEVAFTAGLLSALDVVLGVTAADVERALALSDDLRDALRGAATPLGRLLATVRAYEHATGTSPEGSSDTDLGHAYLSALAWAWAAARAVSVDDPTGDALQPSTV